MSFHRVKSHQTTAFINDTISDDEKDASDISRGTCSLNLLPFFLPGFFSLYVLLFPLSLIRLSFLRLFFFSLANLNSAAPGPNLLFPIRLRIQFTRKARRLRINARS